jgi:hypothetical protein
MEPAKVVYMQDYYQNNVVYMRRCREPGLRAWRLGINLWLCIVYSRGKIWRFLSNPKQKYRFINKDQARFIISSL